MKTGRVRKKAKPAPEAKREEVPARPPSKPPTPKPARRRPAPGAVGVRAKKAPPIGCIAAPFILFVVGIVIIIIAFGGKKADEWVEATRASGEWTTTVTVFGPQVRAEEQWETDCVNDASATVRTSTCVLKEADTYHDDVVDDYEEYAYNVYYEEMWDRTYQAQGTEFVVTILGRDDWWEGNLHYTRQEELDKGSCEYTDYTIWVDDPQDKTQEVEVYLAECEVWDHIVTEERVYDQKSWCQCEMTTLVELGQQSDRGNGANVRWPRPSIPSGGRTEQSFVGKVTFLGDDYTFTTTTEDVAQYQGYLTDRYYIGIRDGKPVSISKNPPQE